MGVSEPLIRISDIERIVDTTFKGSVRGKPREGRNVEARMVMVAMCDIHIYPRVKCIDIERQTSGSINKGTAVAMRSKYKEYVSKHGSSDNSLNRDIIKVYNRIKKVYESRKKCRSV